jgi:hypothetical protein
MLRRAVSVTGFYLLRATHAYAQLCNIHIGINDLSSTALTWLPFVPLIPLSKHQHLKNLPQGLEPNQDRPRNEGWCTRMGLDDGSPFFAILSMASRMESHCIRSLFSIISCQTLHALHFYHFYPSHQ